MKLCHCFTPMCTYWNYVCGDPCGIHRGSIFYEPDASDILAL